MLFKRTSTYNMDTIYVLLYVKANSYVLTREAFCVRDRNGYRSNSVFLMGLTTNYR
jgi:hypothetical protein